MIENFILIIIVKFLRIFLNLQTIAQCLIFSIASFVIIWNFFSRAEAVLNISWAIGFILTFIKFIYENKN